MIVLLLIAVAAVVVWVRHRASSRATLSGLNGERPVFHLEPPRRRMGSRKGERL
jgi:hypothetical protein